MFYALVKKIFLPLFRSRVEVTGLENIPASQGFVIVANHLDFLDGFYLATGFFLRKLPRILFISRTNHYWWTQGAVPIDWKRKADCLDKAVRLLNQNNIIALFAESMRNPAPELLKGKTGAVRLALRARVPIIPVGMKGSYSRYFINSLINFIFFRRKVKINIGHPIFLSQYYQQEVTHELLTDLTRQIMRKIGELCDKKYLF